MERGPVASRWNEGKPDVEFTFSMRERGNQGIGREGEVVIQANKDLNREVRERI